MKLYYNNIINNIENNLNKLYDKYYSKNIFNIINRHLYQQFINKYFEILLNCYKNIEKDMINETINNNILELTTNEYKQLTVFNALNIYEKNSKKLLEQNKSFTKKDVLWSVYSELALKYEFLKEYSTLSIVFERQTDILIEEKKYEQALNIYLCSLYCLFYNYKAISNNNINIFDRHLNKRRKEKFDKLIKINDVNKLSNNFKFSIKEHLPNLYNEEKAKYIIKEILRRI